MADQLLGATPARDDPATLAAIGVLAATFAALAHEAVGHGGACLALGGEVTLLNSIDFRCLGGGGLTDLAGPVGSLVFGALAFTALRWARRPAPRLFLLLSGTIALLWFFAQATRAAIQPQDDFGYAAAQLHWPAAWRGALGAAGVLGYVATVIQANRQARDLGGGLRRFVPPYVAAALSAAIAGACYANDPAGAAWRGFEAVGLAPLGYLWSVRRAGNAGPAIARDWRWIGAGIVVFAAFAVGVGRGLGRLA